MGKRKMGRYWSSEEGWKISTMREVERLKEKISKMRSTCKSHTDDKVAKGECCQQKEGCGESRGKPTNVATFAKRKKVSLGGLV